MSAKGFNSNNFLASKLHTHFKSLRIKLQLHGGIRCPRRNFAVSLIVGDTLISDDDDDHEGATEDDDIFILKRPSLCIITFLLEPFFDYCIFQSGDRMLLPNPSSENCPFRKFLQKGALTREKFTTLGNLVTLFYS